MGVEGAKSRGGGALGRGSLRSSKEDAGSEAIEAALNLCKTATGRGTVLAFQGAYHGMFDLYEYSPPTAPSPVSSGLRPDLRVRGAPAPHPPRCM